jgi:hypothetical protein
MAYIAVCSGFGALMSCKNKSVMLKGTTVEA